MRQQTETNEIKNSHAPYSVSLFSEMVPSYGSLHMSPTTTGARLSK